MQTIINIMLLFLFVLTVAIGFYLIANWRHLVKSDKEREKRFLDWLNQVEQDLNKIEEQIEEEFPNGKPDYWEEGQPDYDKRVEELYLDYLERSDKDLKKEKYE